MINLQLGHMLQRRFLGLLQRRDTQDLVENGLTLRDFFDKFRSQNLEQRQI